MAQGSTIRELLVKIGVKTDKAKFDQVKQGVDDLKRSLGELANYGKRAALVVSGLGVALGAAIIKSANFADDAAKTAKQIGVTTQAWSEMLHVANKANVETESLRVSFSTQARTAYDASRGVKEMASAYAKVGLGVKDVEALSGRQDLLFERVAIGAAGIEDAGVRLAVLQKIYGEGGRKIVPIIDDIAKKGPTAFRDMREEARLLGGTIDQDTGAQAERFNDLILDMKFAIGGVVRQFTLGLLPALSDILDDLKSFFLLYQDWLRLKIDKAVENVSEKIRKFSDRMKHLNERVQKFGGWSRVLKISIGLISGLATAFAAFKVSGPIIAGLKVLRKVILAVMGGTTLTASAVATFSGYLLIAIAVIAEIIAYFAALFLVIEDFYTYLKGGDSVVGRFVEAFNSAGGYIGAVARQMEATKNLVLALLDVLRPLANMLGIVILEAVDSLLYVFMRFIEWVLPNVYGLINAFAEFFGITEGIQSLTGYFERLTEILQNLAPLLDKAFGAAKNFDDVKAGFSMLFNTALGGSGYSPSAMGASGTGIVPNVAASPSGSPTNISNRNDNMNLNITIPGSQDPNAVGKAVTREITQARSVIYGGEI